MNSVFAGGKTSTSDFTLYVNPYLVAQNGGRYTKHIYIGSQRIVSKLGDFDSYGADPRRVEKAGESFSGVKVNYDAKYKKALEITKANYDAFEVPYYGVDNNDYVNGLGFCCNPSQDASSSSSTTAKSAKNDNAELQQFYYHPDHLGSSSYISNLDGEVVQHIEYVPFGEVFLEEKNAKWNTPYLFTSKELDRETGLYYYGARYYDSKLSLWASVDPQREKHPEYSSYIYVANNPLKLIDPDGRDWIKNNTTGKFEWKNGVTSKFNTPKGYVYIGKENNSIVMNLFGTNSISDSSRDIGLISIADFDNPHSAKGAAFMNMMTNTTLTVSFSADISTVYNSDGSVKSKDFKGINISASVSGDIVAPYPDIDISLVVHNMKLQGNEMKAHEASRFGEFRQGGRGVATTIFDSYWNSSSIQRNFGKSFILDFSFTGQYLNGNTPMSFLGAAGILGLPNTTETNVSAKFNNTAAPILINPNKL
ncbi:RHS repeat-associated core domain-containing protein [Flavobacterium sp. KACC 22761]|uniref:RHS repeat domain-containing protein n=1 Tax=Flavobacterium sp. KACC 22761 TaxID=3092665 RepID=UPI002A74A46D|nr:RHS repeat-associated core domain-containing protein [Flavobacterium sp. KACC 22761]WPO78018.1 RHS repeat-associated core domain-containing protein [Flavobacterium sp. KACC 22761]